MNEPDTQEQQADRRDEIARSIEPHLLDLDFAELDKKTNQVFSEWLHDRIQDANYLAELHDMLYRTETWRLSAFEVATDYADHLIEVGAVK